MSEEKQVLANELGDLDSSLEEDISIANNRKALEIEKRREELESLKQDRLQRKSFGGRLFMFMCAYMFSSLLIVSLVGLKCMSLSDVVLVTLMTTTLADVISVFAFVAKYLFHVKE